MPINRHVYGVLREGIHIGLEGLRRAVPGHQPVRGCRCSGHVSGGMCVYVCVCFILIP